MALTKFIREQDQGFFCSKQTWTAWAICLHGEAVLLAMALQEGE